MRVHNVLALAAACLFAGTASASTILISSDGSNINNGALFSDPAGVAAGAGVGLNMETVASTNGFGRALAFNGNTFASGDGTDLAAIEDNPGVQIDGFAVYRVQYQGGSDAYGFVENGAGAAGGGTNTAFDGRAFANSSDYFLLSDDIAVSGGDAGDTFNVSIDNFSSPDSVTAFIYFDNGTGINLGSILGGSITDISAPAVGYSSVRVGFFVDNANGADSGLDNVNLELIPVPEPSAVALGLLGLAGVAVRRRC